MEDGIKGCKDEREEGRKAGMNERTNKRTKK